MGGRDTLIRLRLNWNEVFSIYTRGKVELRFNGFFEDSYGTLIKDELSFLMNITVKPVSKLRRN